MSCPEQKLLSIVIEVFDSNHPDSRSVKSLRDKLEGVFFVNTMHFTTHQENPKDGNERVARGSVIRALLN